MRPLSGASARAGVRTAGLKITRQHVARRMYADAAPEPKKSGSGLPMALLVAAVGAGGVYYYMAQNDMVFGQSANKIPTADDYKAVYKTIAGILEENAEDYDDGSYGPVLTRLAWHASGTYDKTSGTGGSNGATMRYAPESMHGANAGLEVARKKLEPVKEKYPWISYSDLWTLGGVCAVQQMGGPTIPWRPGRKDADETSCTPDGRLPDASKDQKHLRDIFYRMGFNDQEIVALSGAHTLGRCHTTRSGYDGPWQFAPTTFSNEYFRLLTEDKWHWRKWNGPKQYENDSTKTLMMLPTDMALLKDKEFSKWVKIYAKDENKFFGDFSKAFSTLLELGVPFPEGSKPMTFDVISE